MTAKEFADKMREIRDNTDGDTELVHLYADALLCELLRELGYGEGVVIFEEMKKWYA